MDISSNLNTILPRKKNEPKQINWKIVGPGIALFLLLTAFHEVPLVNKTLSWLSPFMVVLNLTVSAGLAGFLVERDIHNGQIDLLCLTPIPRKAIRSGYVEVTCRLLVVLSMVSAVMAALWPYLQILAQRPNLSLYNSTARATLSISLWFCLMRCLIAVTGWRLYRAVAFWSVRLAMRWRRALPAATLASAGGLMLLALFAVIAWYARETFPEKWVVSYVCPY